MDVLKRIFRGPVIWVLVGLIALFVAFQFIGQTGFREITTQEGLELLEGSTVEEVKIVDGEQRVDLTLSDSYEDLGTLVQFYYVQPRGTEVIAAITASDATFDDEVPQSPWFVNLLSILVPFLLIGVIIWFLFSSMQNGGNRVMQFGKSRAKLVSKETPQVTFADVAGASEAVEELHEIKDFLKDPARFQAVVRGFLG